jgi:hypothetical protein
VIAVFLQVASPSHPFPSVAHLRTANDHLAMFDKAWVCVAVFQDCVQRHAPEIICPSSTPFQAGTTHSKQVWLAKAAAKTDATSGCFHVMIATKFQPVHRTIQYKLCCTASVKCENYHKGVIKEKKKKKKKKV